MTKRLTALYVIFVLIGLWASVIAVSAWTNPSAAPPSGDPGPMPITRGGTAGTTTSGARSNLGAAASGANSDITSLTGLTTALTTSQGGIGAALTISKGDLLIGINTGGSFTRLATSTNGYRLTASSTATHGISWETVSTSEGGGWTDDGTAVRLTTVTDSVGIGIAVPTAALDVRSVISIGANAATTGALRLPNSQDIYARNAANSANIQIVGTDASNNVTLASGGATVIVGGGTGKINVGTVDPIYNIGNEKYATYLPGMTGIKEETTGVARLTSGSYEIDLTKAERGSDIWLFYQITDFGKDWENLSVLLSPSFEGNVWYKKEPSQGKLIIYGSQNSEVSYRLTANRFDYKDQPNTSNSAVDGFPIGEK